jgi:hypothetical protein
MPHKGNPNVKKCRICRPRRTSYSFVLTIWAGVSSAAMAQVSCAGPASTRGPSRACVSSTSMSKVTASPRDSALMTGRHPIRTGALQSVPSGLPLALHPGEITLAQLLSQQGDAAAIDGKWHLGDCVGRFPTDRGFDECAPDDYDPTRRANR